VDENGNAYVTGVSESYDFHITPGAAQSIKRESSDDAFVAKIKTAPLTPAVMSVFLQEQKVYVLGVEFDAGASVLIEY
jgi:hypothetical protein